MHELLTVSMLLAMAVAAVSGIIRGITGFGGAMVMTPPLALIFGPKLAVPVVLLLETFAAAPMLRDAARAARWRVIAPISAAACVTIPLGGYLLVTAEPDMLRRAIAVTVIAFSLLLLKGVRYSGPQRMSTSVALGGVSGIMLGATSIGAPPVILYLLSGPAAVQVTRANLTLYVVVISAAGLMMLWSRGVLDGAATVSALLLAPFFYSGVVAGTHFFTRFSEQRFRQFTLLLMTIVSIGVLLA